ncbi:hypothetical protein B0H16DRAFT_1788095 [Mycena metata]|uniref:Uncharacterized protein n=1 Tax=Mycena metata TaxID=1033252 RepID=A0AAD7HMA5_9AGAR|nr:hypothetical protein B0H16DRAFT_1788095 [Mycena metata]
MAGKAKLHTQRCRGVVRTRVCPLRHGTHCGCMSPSSHSRAVRTTTLHYIANGAASSAPVPAGVRAVWNTEAGSWTRPASSTFKPSPSSHPTLPAHRGHFDLRAHHQLADTSARLMKEAVDPHDPEAPHIPHPALEERPRVHIDRLFRHTPPRHGPRPLLPRAKAKVKRSSRPPYTSTPVLARPTAPPPLLHRASTLADIQAFPTHVAVSLDAPESSSASGNWERRSTRARRSVATRPHPTSAPASTPLASFTRHIRPRSKLDNQRRRTWAPAALPPLSYAH